MDDKRIMVLGVGNLLFCDEGFGVRVIQEIEKWYDLPDNVSLVDGNVLGLNLLGIISQADHLIVVDAVRNKGCPGDLYRIDGEEVPKRIRAKNSLHQVDLLEALTLVQALDHEPETVILGIEPKDIESMTLEMTPEIEKGVAPVIGMVMAELDRLGITSKKRGVPIDVSCHTLEDRED